MIVGAYLERAAPEHPAGAEWTIQDTMTWLAGRGHDCRVVARVGARRERIDDVMVYTQPSPEELTRHFQECDVMLTQLEAVPIAQVMASVLQTPLVTLVHSASQIESLGVMESCCSLLAFNAQHVADDCSWWAGASMVLHPPIHADRVRVARGGDTVKGMCSTLVNLSHNKGAITLYTLAQSLETLPFLGVMGAYGEQTMQPSGIPGSKSVPAPTGIPANMRVEPITEDIRTMLAYTRTLLVLSMHETYGRIAGEAIISGIPVIATDTPGLRECLGDAGVYFADRGEYGVLEALVKRAYTAEWMDWSLAAVGRAEQNAKRQQKELVVFEKHLRRIHREQPAMIL